MASSHGNKQKHESKNPVQRALIGHFHKRLSELVLACQPSEILEVGCGDGAQFCSPPSRSLFPYLGLASQKPHWRPLLRERRAHLTPPSHQGSLSESVREILGNH